MTRIRIQIAGDGSSAEAIAAAGFAVSVRELRDELQRAGVQAGIDNDAVEAFAQRLADPGYDGTAVLARGTAAVAGEDGRVDCAIDTRFRPGREHEDGHIDWHERQRLHPVAAGQPLGVVVAPTPGTVGIDVRGRRLEPRPGRPHAVRIGAGVALDGDRLVAARAGVLLRDARQLDVMPLYSHAGDVDLRSGNLHTEGSLEIRGDVREGLAATAAGDIVVGGTVQGGTVTAGGSVRVAQGIVGRDSIVRAGASIHCRHATSARLCAEGTVEITDHATSCTVLGEHVHVRTGRGTVVGGELRARRAIRLLHAGVVDGAVTLLAVADLTAEQTDAARRAASGARLERQAVRSRRDHGRAGAKALRSAVRTADATREEKLRLAQLQRELLQAASIEIAGTAQPGVRLRFGVFTRQLEEPRSRVRFVWDPEHDRMREESLS
ncbi:MAG: DUF342 domain-containing protein [Planctomycetes bacterium]|nr:DUF342 domain-containing protein [Planctomycetota bacterium]